MSASFARAGRLGSQRGLERGLAELLGLARGVIADGRVSGEEARQLEGWARAHPDVARRWPADVLASRLERVFRDGRADSKERRRLAAVLEQVAASPASLDEAFPLATDLPLTRPEPAVTFEGRTFVFAGDMAHGSTRACEREVEDLGGECERAVNRRTDYLVIGALAATDWTQAGFGDAVDEVVRYRARGASIAIISEAHWAAALP